LTPEFALLGALSAGRFRQGRQYDFGDQARIDEMLRVLARRERDFAPAPIDRHEFRMIDRKGKGARELLSSARNASHLSQALW